MGRRDKALSLADRLDVPSGLEEVFEARSARLAHVRRCMLSVVHIVLRAVVELLQVLALGYESVGWTISDVVPQADPRIACHTSSSSRFTRLTFTK